MDTIQPPARAEITEPPDSAPATLADLPRLLTLHDLAARYRIPHSTAYELMNKRMLDAVKLGGRTLILTESVERLLAGLPRFGG